MTNNKEEARARGRTADRWVKIIGLVALFTTPMIGIISKLMLNYMDQISERQSMTIKAINNINVSIGTYGGRLSRAEKDIKEISVDVKEITKRVYKLEGRK
jgi:hypothetical protein